MRDNNVDSPMMTLQRLRVLKTHDYSKNSQTSIKVMERQMGFEPTTLCLGSRCSTPELLSQNTFNVTINYTFLSRLSTKMYSRLEPLSSV